MPEQRVHIVMIDDDEIDVEAVARLLSRHAVPFTLTVFSNGRDAQEALTGDFGSTLHAQPFLILLDLNMPRMNGFEFLDWLRGDPFWQRAIVLVFTTSSILQDRERAYDRCVAGYLSKGLLGPNYSSLLELLDSLRSIVTFPTP
jgi:CheY-like chemotaxis protein